MGPRTGKPFTVWSDGELVGETHLDYVANTSEVKFGDFAATEFGERVIAIRMAPRKALCAHAPWKEVEALHACRESVSLELRAPDGRNVPTEDIEITDLEWLISLAPTQDVEESWQDDLRLSEFELADELHPEPPFRDELAELFPPDPADPEEVSWPDDYGEAAELSADSTLPEFPRYQIQVHIKGGG